MIEQKFDLKPHIVVDCPFCEKRFIRKLDFYSVQNITCDCGAEIEFCCAYEFGDANKEKGAD